MRLIDRLVRLHHAVFTVLERWTAGWLLGALARFVFLAVLFFYFLNSARTKVGDGIAGFFKVQDGAYFQILTEQGMAAYDFDSANVPFYLDLIVYMGTYSEFLLPVLIVLGLFTRIAAIGMIIFVFVQSYVDIYLHKVNAETVGAWFDRESGALIYDQRALWVFVLLILVVRGAGALCLDRLLFSWWERRH